MKPHEISEVARGAALAFVLAISWVGTFALGLVVGALWF